MHNLFNQAEEAFLLLDKVKLILPADILVGSAHSTQRWHGVVALRLAQNNVYMVQVFLADDLTITAHVLWVPMGTAPLDNLQIAEVPFGKLVDPGGHMGW